MGLLHTTLNRLEVTTCTGLKLSLYLRHRVIMVRRQYPSGARHHHLPHGRWSSMTAAKHDSPAGLSRTLQHALIVCAQG